MGTSFDDIYEKFLGSIDDYELGLVTEEELRKILFGYLDTARSLYFPQCNKDLDKISVSNGMGSFESNLDSQEQYILALGMKKAWLSAKKHSSELMSKDIGDRDYKAVQGYNYIRELSTLDRRIDDEIRTYSVEYSYKDFNLDGW